MIQPDQTISENRDVVFIEAALSWYDGRPAAADVQEAWARLKRIINTAENRGEPVVCGCCGESVYGPCHHPGDPCGLYDWPPLDVGDAKQSSTRQTADDASGMNPKDTPND